MGRRLVRELSVHDWILGGYLAALLLALVAAPPHPARGATLLAVAALTSATAAAVLAVRGAVIGPGLAAAILYRIAVVGGLLGSYFLLRDVLPIVNHGAWDQQLRALDVALFGGDPVLWLDRFVTPRTTEWFACFYSGYFALLAVYLLPMLASRRAQLQNELGIGVFGIFTVGHLLYMLVPGVGPYRAFADEFPTPLPSGPWLDALLHTVRASGALKDIFPSLHTAAPLFLVAFAFRHRDQRPFGSAWAPTAFVAANMIAGAVFLRWHYVVDILAGFALGAVAVVLAPRVARWELARRARHGLGPVWPNA